MSKNLRGLSSRKGLTENLFREIVKAGSSSSGERDQILADLSGRYLVGKSAILSSSSFYDFLKGDHILKKALRCNGTACMTSDKNEKLKKALDGRFGETGVGTITCLGHCHSANAFMIDNNTFSFEDLDNPDKLKETWFSGGGAFLCRNQC